MKFLRLFGSTSQRDAVLASIDYKILQKTEGVPGVELMQGTYVAKKRSVQFRMSPEYGTVTVNSNPVSHGTTIEFAVGETIHLHAEPLNATYSFVEWTNNRGIEFANPSNQNLDVVVPEGTTTIRIVANFTENIPVYTISAFVVPPTAGEVPLAVREVQEGNSTTVVVNPLNADHFVFTGWALSDNPADTKVCETEAYEIIDIHEDKKVYAHYTYLNQ